MTRTMTNDILLPRFQREKVLLTQDGVPKDPYRRRHGPAEEGMMTPTLPPFLRPGSLHSPTFLLNVGPFHRANVVFWWQLRAWRWTSDYILYCWMGRWMWLARFPLGYIANKRPFLSLPPQKKNIRPCAFLVFFQGNK